jgi:ankyrin repeat protein
MLKTLSGAFLAVLILTIPACKSAPKEKPQEESVWSLLARGDERAKDFFLGDVDVHATDSRGRTPLHYAAEQQNPNLAAFFIAMGAEVDALDNTQQTPLGISADRGDPKVGKVLAAAGADIHKPARGGASPAKAAFKHDGAFLQSILTPATVASTDSEGKTILHLASEIGNVNAVKIILAAIESAGTGNTPLAAAGSRDIPLDKKDNAGNNPLDIALARPDSRDHMVIAEQLILAGSFSENFIYSFLAPAVRNANFDFRRAGGFTPLHFAAGAGYDGLIAFLVERKANVNLKNSAGATPLHEAARSGNIRSIELILKSGADINAQDAKGNSVLHTGIPPDNHLDAVTLFLANGVNPNLLDEHGESPLHILITLNRKPETIQALLNGGADVSLRNIDGQTPLYAAVRENRVSIIPLLLAYGSDIFAADNSGITPFDRALAIKGPVLTALITPETVLQRDSAGNTMLHAAVNGGSDTEIAAAILNQKADVNARNKEGETALHIAVREDYRETGELLLSRGADIFSSNSAGESPLYLALIHPLSVVQWFFTPRTAEATDGLGNSMLHYTAMWKLDQFIPFIISKGISTEAVNATSETALFMAARYDGASTAQALLAVNANLHARDILGNSALHAAVRWNAVHSVNTLIDAGIDVNTHALDGTTPLHDAVRLGLTSIAALLIDRHADIEVRDAAGNTPFMEAVRAGFSGTMELLARKGADPMTRNSRGDTPLHIAVTAQDTGMVTALLRMGVSIHARNTRNRTPFQTALVEAPGLINILLTKDRINGSDDFGNSALHIALQEKAQAATIKIIIDKGARQTAVDSNGRIPLRLAVDMDALESARVLADSGSDPFFAAVDGKTPAEIVLAGSDEMVRALFSGRAISARDASGNTVLHYAARMGKPGAITLLLELGANKGVKNIAAESPADIANRWNQRENAALLN